MTVLDERQASAFLGLSVHTLRKWRRRDPGPILEPVAPQVGQNLSVAAVAVSGQRERRDADDSRAELPELLEREAFAPTRSDDDLSVGDPVHGVLERFQGSGLQPVAGRVLAPEHAVYVEEKEHEEHYPWIWRWLRDGAVAAELQNEGLE
jgi:hypothetical protein